MTMHTRDFARLAEDAYRDRRPEEKSGKPIRIGEYEYRVIATHYNPQTGYQGNAYQRKNTDEVIIAHRGTQAPWQDLRDTAADIGMVKDRANRQLPEAIAFTHRVIEIAKADAEQRGVAPQIMITGHSLGGTEAEVTGAITRLRTETFNAYGAGDLNTLSGYGVYAKGPYPNIIGHRRATDPVSAASPHLGEVRSYATAMDLETLHKGGYLTAGAKANPFKALDVSAHGVVSNFSQSSVLTPENVARASTVAGATARFVHDVSQGRADAHALIKNGPGAAHSVGRLSGQTVDAYAPPAARVLIQATANHARAELAFVDGGVEASRIVLRKTGELASTASTWVGQQMEAVRKSLDLSDPDHPGHPLYREAQQGMRRLDERMGRTPDRHTDNLAACLAIAACRQGLTRIDDVEMGTDGKKVWAAQQPGTAFSKAASAGVEGAIVPVEQTSQQWAQASQNHAEQQQRQLAEQAQRQQSAPAMTRGGL